jgi:hypothetical protein
MLQQFFRRQSALLRQSAWLLALGLMCPLGGSMRLEDMPPGQLQYRNRAGMARPSAVDAGSWCDACHATVDMMTLLLRHDWSASAVSPNAVHRGCGGRCHQALLTR